MSSTKHTFATERVGQIYLCCQELQSRGWKVCEPASNEGFRRPLLLPGEKMCLPLDGSLSDQRAQGFTAVRDGAVLRVDCSAGLELLVLVDEGDTREAHEIVGKHLGEPKPRSLRWRRISEEDSEILTLVTIIEGEEWFCYELDRETPYLVEICSGPEIGEGFVGLYDLDGERVDLWNVEWTAAHAAPADVLELIERTWFGAEHKMERL